MSVKLQNEPNFASHVNAVPWPNSRAFGRVGGKFRRAGIGETKPMMWVREGEGMTFCRVVRSSEARSGE